ncbi:hypothetical protein nbrc107696_23510 [Gordonia spumicola]|uniref:DUF262 domain-containing protein n=1 Tax=Gordonia spumicola TaxID=589161 RepID=A0A7I9V9B1_9ACTN|nr:DUF262 domain-containing protein [Gordonia spumicola]GEE01905.1 hypothetical protein nbrc107696_23510 [Gordonia spumicola]
MSIVETHKRTPQQLFNQPQHFVIPLFQRAYVWKEDEQWEPLWKDVRRVAELRITDPSREIQHFLGAVVLQASEARIDTMPTWNVIDGQQRLTTLQIMMDSVGAVIMRPGTDRFARRLESLTHNSADYVPDGESRLKLRHLNTDRTAFDDVMDAEPPVDYAAATDPDSQIVKAHRYFTTEVTQWLGDADTDAFIDRAEALATVLQAQLQLVTIELTAAENSQEIFETLNARGTPLTAADLVRNFVFQRIEAEGGDAKRTYDDVWPFETRFWAKEVSVGRYLVSRSSLFLNQWLSARLGEDVSPQSTFTRFKAYVEHDPAMRVVDLLPIIKTQADLYESWTTKAADVEGSLDRTCMAVYRMAANTSELLKPVLIWLHDPIRVLPGDVIDGVIGTFESWVQRRQLLRLSSSDLGRVVADSIRLHQTTPVDELVHRVTNHLARLKVTSTYWPGDAEVRAALTTELAYRRYSRARLRAILEAIENDLRSETRQPQVERTKLPIEHILPQKWRDTWPVAEADEADRQEHVHRLGNLTLLTTSLNSKVSNGAWAAKRDALLRHNTIKLTGRLIELTQESEWNEDLIDQRTDEMISAILRVWPVPDGHVGEVADPQTKAQDWVMVKHLVEATFLAEGDVLHATHRDHPDATATVTRGGLEINGHFFTSPSGASRHFRNTATNGWYFWAVADGRRLADVRSEFLEAAPTR